MLGVIKLSGGDLASGPLAFSCSEGERGAVVTGRMRNSEQQQDGCKSEPNTSFFFFFFSRCFCVFGSFDDQTGARLGREKLRLLTRGAPPFIFGLLTLLEVKPNAEKPRTVRRRPGVPVFKRRFDSQTSLNPPCLSPGLFTSSLNPTASTGQTPRLLLAEAKVQMFESSGRPSG